MFKRAKDGNRRYGDVEEIMVIMFIISWCFMIALDKCENYFAIRPGEKKTKTEPVESIRRKYIHPSNRAVFSFSQSDKLGIFRVRPLILLQRNLLSLPP